MNSKVAKKYGTPHNISTGNGGRSTKAAGRPTTNKSVSGNKMLGGASRYGVNGVGK